MSARKKLPAFGAALRDRRRRGDHPLCVHLIYGYKWRAGPQCAWQAAIAAPHPELCIKPEDYAPDTFDFGVMVGLQVCVFDQVGGAAYDEQPPPAGNLWRMVGELAAVAADVEIHSAVAFGPACSSSRWSAFEIAAWRRRRDGVASVNNGWPSWWSDEIERENAKRRIRWLDAVKAVVEQRQPARECA